MFLERNKIFGDAVSVLPSESKGVENKLVINITPALAVARTDPVVKREQELVRGVQVNMNTVTVYVPDPFKVGWPVLQKVVDAFLRTSPEKLPSAREAVAFARDQIIRIIASSVVHELHHAITIAQNQVKGFNTAEGKIPAEVTNAYIFRLNQIFLGRTSKYRKAFFDAIERQGSVQPSAELPQRLRSKILELVANERFVFDLANERILCLTISNRLIAEEYSDMTICIASEYYPRLRGQKAKKFVRGALLALMEESFR
ncbi:MAG TPA: hypothetical protein ENJ18_16145 [Nannocystis exedens]|nr:hypothetical protein [Nannocystis exedens]